MMRRIGIIVVKILGARWFFWGVIGFFVLEALWFVFSAQYPMAFDEEVHLGIIKVYAQGWSPFLASQPVGADSFGALTSDPSYLYHYLMSFPYRLLALITDNLTTQVIVLRLLNVGIFAGALVLFRWVLAGAKLSPALAHVVMAVVALIPVAPMLAAHINYDNLLTLLVAWICWLVIVAMRWLDRRIVPLGQLALLAAVCLLAAVVKYAALPIVAATGVFVIYYIWRSFRGHGRQFWTELGRSARALSRPAKVGLGTLLVIGMVLCLQRYGVNIYKYQSLVPECDAVLGVERCQAYGPWQRNHRMAQEKGQFNRSPLHYTKIWQHDMRRRLFFAVNGPHHGYTSQPALPVPLNTAGLLTLASVVLVIVFWRRIFRGHAALIFFAVVIGLYTAVLWLTGYGDYLYTGSAVAINGRYFLPIMVLLGAVAGRAFSLALAGRTGAKAGLAALVLLFFLHGGGVLTFILRSDATWYWPNQAVVEANQFVRNIARPFIFE